MSVNHVAIQTHDLKQSVRWYEEFLGGRVEWTLREFSELTHSRLPGIGTLVEVKIGELRLHIFDRADATGKCPAALDLQFQHLGVTVERGEDLPVLRRRWIQLYESGQFAYARPDGPSDIVVDDDGMESLYVLDPNGLELEFIYFRPQGS